jgi:hypothetical protein
MDIACKLKSLNITCLKRFKRVISHLIENSEGIWIATGNKLTIRRLFAIFRSVSATFLKILKKQLNN